MQLFNIAGLLISYSGYMNAYTAKRFDSYKVSNEEKSPDVFLFVEKTTDDINIPDGDVLMDIGSVVWLRSGSETIWCLKADEVNGAAAMVRYSDNEIRITVLDLKSKLGYDDCKYLFNILAYNFHYICIMNGRLVLHSSAISYNGEGVAFSADSGVGKSTHTGLWIKHIPGAEYINDDTPIVFSKNGKAYISGTPFAGTSGINNNITVPLRAIVFINRANENFLEPADTPAAIRLMIAQIKSPVDDSMMGKFTEIMNEILSCVPVYIMHCNISPDAAYIALEAIYGIRGSGTSVD